MGTTLTAIVECREPSETDARAWWRFATLHLGKDYAAMARLSEVAKRDWPSDVCDRDAPQHDFHRYWMSGLDLVQHLRGVSAFSRALCSTVLALDADTYGVRVLFIER